MKTLLIPYIISLVIMLAIDGLWLTTMSKSFYGKYIGHLMSPSPSLPPAAIFYLIYILALSILVIMPGLKNNTSILQIFFLGSLFGLAAYGTYDLTNQATLKNWPVIVTAVDLIWGSLLTGIVAGLTAMITRFIS